MTEQKKPQSGEWWQKDLTRVFIIGTKKNGLAVGETEFGTLIPFLPIHDWNYLPNCDSFDWQPEVFTQTELTASYQSIPAADLPPVESPYEYRILREDEETVATDERMYPDGYRSWTAMTAMDGWESGMTVKELRAKFMSWHNVVVRRKVVLPVESPDDWVEITDPNHEPRDGVDWFNGGPSGQWMIHEPRHVRSTLKEYQQSWPMGRFRCRRKDLPPLPSPKRVPVRLWCETTVSDGDCNGVFAHQDEQSSCHEIKHDANGFYVEVQP